MKHRPFLMLFLTCRDVNPTKTVSGGQFWWGTILPKSNGGVYKGQLSRDGNAGGRVKAQAGFTARRACRAVAKAELSEPTARHSGGRRNRIKVTLGITG